MAYHKTQELVDGPQQMCGPVLLPMRMAKLLPKPDHNDLKTKGVWVWPQGCIEHVTSATAKGEDAIIEQEQQLQAMSKEDTERDMPALKECFEWVTSV